MDKAFKETKWLKQRVEVLEKENASLKKSVYDLSTRLSVVSLSGQKSQRSPFALEPFVISSAGNGQGGGTLGGVGGGGVGGSPGGPGGDGKMDSMSSVTSVDGHLGMVKRWHTPDGLIAVRLVSFLYYVILVPRRPPR